MKTSLKVLLVALGIWFTMGALIGDMVLHDVVTGLAQAGTTSIFFIIPYWIYEYVKKRTQKKNEVKLS